MSRRLTIVVAALLVYLAVAGLFVIAMGGVGRRVDELWPHSPGHAWAGCRATQSFRRVPGLPRGRPDGN